MVGAMNLCNSKRASSSLLCISKFSNVLLLRSSISTSVLGINNPLESFSPSWINAAFSLFFTSSIKSKSAHQNNWKQREVFERPIGQSPSSADSPSAQFTNFNHRKVSETAMNKSRPLTNAHMTAAHGAPQGLTHRERRFENWIQKLQRGFQPEDVVEVLKQQRDVDLCFDIFRWASQQKRYKHNHLTYHVMIQKFASAARLNKVEILVNEILAGACDGNEALFNTTIYIYIQASKLEKAINVYRHMRKTSDCKPSLRTYNILLSALVDKCTDSYVSHLYMRNIRALFKQMVAANVAPDIFTLNTMIKGYSKSLRLNDALRIFHQMELYCCTPDAHTFNYLIKGLCLQSRTDNAMQIYQDMIGRGFVPSNMVYNSLVNSLSFCGELQRATKVLREMIEKGGVPDFITYKTLVDGLCKEGKREQAKQLLREFRVKDLALDGFSDRKLLNHLQLWNETADIKNSKIS